MSTKEGGVGNLNEILKKKISKSKINMLILALLLIVIMIAVFLGIIMTRQMSEKHMEMSLQEQSISQSAILRDKIDSQFAMLTGLASAFTKEDLKDLDFMLEKLMEGSKRSEFITLDFAYPDGTAYRNDGKKMDLSDRWYFKQCMNGKNAIEFLESGKLVAEERVAIAVPVIPNDKVEGVLVGDYNREQLQKLFEAVSSYETQISYVCDSNGVILVGTEEGMRVLEANAPAHNQAEKIADLLKNAEFSRGSCEEVKSRMQYQARGMLIYTLGGEKWYTLYEPLKINDWFVVTFLREEQIYHASMETVRASYIMAAAVMVVVIVIIVLLAIREHRHMISEKEKADELQYILEHDELTGILCERVFMERVKQRLEMIAPEEYCLIYLDVYKFKLINEMFGYEKGDELLCTIAKELEELSLKYNGLCGRIAGDKFVLFVPHQQEIIADFDIRMKQERQLLPVEIYLHYGVYVIKDANIPVAQMIDCAQLAQKEIKGNYDNYVFYYNDRLKQHILREQEIISSMSAALSSGEFIVYLQPQYQYKNGEISGAEALVRWNSPTKGLISPGEFIPVFERNGFIIKLDEYVWESVCRLLRKWLDEGKKPVALSVNVSRSDLLKGAVAKKLTELIEKYSLTPKLLRVEVTESAYMDNPQKLIMEIEELHAAGFVVEMDDFGSGYSSLNTLKDVPINILKTDLKFLSDTGIEERKTKILDSIVNMAHQMGMTVIAEGVETKEQADYLLQLDCKYMQGFYFSRPIPVKEFEKLVYGM